MFSAVLHCPTGIKLYQFFKNLLERESVRTIIQSLVRTLESGKIEGRAHKEKANEFYQLLDKILHLQYGKVLLALSTRSQLQDLLDKDLPFFTNFTQDVRKCLNDSKICERVQHLIQSLGNFSHICKKIIATLMAGFFYCPECPCPSVIHELLNSNISKFEFDTDPIQNPHYVPVIKLFVSS